MYNPLPLYYNIINKDGFVGYSNNIERSEEYNCMSFQVRCSPQLDIFLLVVKLIRNCRLSRGRCRSQPSSQGLRANSCQHFTDTNIQETKERERTSEEVFNLDHVKGSQRC